METIPFSANVRADFGKGSARKLRSKGLVPAVIYRAGDEPTHLSLDPHALRMLFQMNENPNLLVAIEVDGQEHVCLLKDADMHPVSRAILHVDFYAVDAGEEVTVEVPVRPVGTSKGAELGGRVRIVRHTVRIKAKPGAIPECVEVDVSHLEVGMVISAGELELADGCTVAMDDSVSLLRCIGKRAELVVETTAGMMEDEEELAEGEEAAEEGAEAPEEGAED